MNRNAMLKKFAIGLVLLVAATLSFAESGQGRHKKIYVVPAPSKVVIDGKLDDWDLSGQLEMYVMTESKETQSARFALMYDADALYVSGVVRDPSPMMNRHDPAVEATRGWDADSCQFRLTVNAAQGFPVKETQWDKPIVDNPRLIHATLWNYTDRQEACLHILCGMNMKLPRPEWPQGAVPKDKFEGKYLKSQDGHGYTFEYRIPWNTLNAEKPLKGGDVVAGTVQFNWGKPDGLATAGGSAWCYDVMSSPGFTYQNAGCWGKMIFSDKGNLPKELVEEGLPPEKPQPLTFDYNVPADSELSVTLFNKAGDPVRGIVAQGKRSAGKNTELWDGRDDNGKVLTAGEYAWKGVWHQPITQKFVLSVHNSGQPPYKTDDGTGGWGGDHASSQTICRAGKDHMLLAWDSAEAGWGIIKTDLTGKKLWGLPQAAMHLACDGERFFAAGDHGFQKHLGVKVFDLKEGRPLNYGNGKSEIHAPDSTEGNEVLSNHAEKDEKQKAREQNDEVTGLALRDGTLYVSYAKRNMIGLFDARQGTPKTTWSVPTPGRAVALKDGMLAVISGNEVLLLKDGKVPSKIADNLDIPKGITVDTKGNFYVSNSGKLQNVSVFNPEGKYVKSIGKTGGRPLKGLFESDGMLEPGGLDISADGALWVAETLDSPKRQSVWNIETGSLIKEFFGGTMYFAWAWMDPKHPDEIYCHNVRWKVDLDKGIWKPLSTIWRATAPNMVTETGLQCTDHAPIRVFTAKNGKQYMNGNCNHAPLLYLVDGPLFKPFAGVLRIVRPPKYAPTGENYPLLYNDPKQYPDGMYFWQDENNDQIVQANEVTALPDNGSLPMISFMDAELNAWCNNGFILRPQSIDANGRPHYDLAKKEAIPAAPRMKIEEDGSSYSLNSYEQKPRFQKWGADLKPQWGYDSLPWPKAINMGLIKPGMMRGLTMPLGVAGGFTGAASYFGPYHILTTDGIYVAMLMRDNREPKGLGADCTAVEVVHGQLVKPDGMNRYFLLAGDQDGRVTEIFGLDTVKPFSGGSYVITDEMAKKTADAWTEYEKALQKTSRLDIARGLKALEQAGTVGKRTEDGRSFEVRAAYDEKNLCLQYDVRSPDRLVNAGTDPQLIFKGGNCLDLQIATDPAADPKRKTPAPGDVRILVTKQNAKTFAVIYRPKVKDFKGNPVVLSSPGQSEFFDVIETTQEISLDCKDGNGGFVATVTVPLKLIGLELKPGAKLKMDVGYIFGNKEGNKASLRSYWSNNSFAANVTYDVPHESRLEPAEWGEAVVE